MPINTKKSVRPVRQRNYLNKDFDSLRSDLITYARAFYADRIQDFSEASLGGVFLDLAAYVGDVMSFYLDHQFSELFVDTAVEIDNIENLIRDAGVEITGNSPAVVDLSFFIEVPAEKIGTTFEPTPSSLSIIRQGTVCAANNGTRFELIKDIDFSERDSDGDLVANIRVGSTNPDGSPLTLILERTELGLSGFTRTETFIIPNTFVSFREITLGSENVTEIKSVIDAEGNEYYRVGSLTQDTVFKGIPNMRSDNGLVERLLEVLPAPYRYTAETGISSRLTTLMFGGGKADSLDNDIIPDPSEFAIPLFGKKTFDRFSIDPNKLLDTRTLGVAPQSTTLTVSYRFGGGLSHNVAAGTIRTVSTLLMSFPSNPTPALAAQVRASVDVRNNAPALGGENAPTINDLKSKVPSARNAQARIVTREDLLARVYTMPSNFGRVFRAGVRSNPINPLAAQLFIISRDANRQLVASPDSLKENLITYLNQFRMISDAIDILDSPIINVGVEFEVATDPSANKSLVIQNIISRLKTFFSIDNYQIDQPIRVSDVQNIIFNNHGVISVTNLRFKTLTGVLKGREYSDNTVNISTNTVKGLIFPSPGGIFEVKYPDFDIVGNGV
jgi:hypothetical protein